MLTPAVASVLALAVAIVLSCATQLDVGLIAIAMAWNWPARSPPRTARASRTAT